MNMKEGLAFSIKKRGREKKEFEGWQERSSKRKERRSGEQKRKMLALGYVREGGRKKERKEVSTLELYFLQKQPTQTPSQAHICTTILHLSFVLFYFNCVICVCIMF